MRDRILRDCHRLSRHQCDTICYADRFADVSKMIAMPESDAEVACSYRILLNCQGLLDGSKESYMHYLHNISLAPLIYYFRNEHI